MKINIPDIVECFPKVSELQTESSHMLHVYLRVYFPTHDLIIPTSRAKAASIDRTLDQGKTYNFGVRAGTRH